MKTWFHRESWRHRFRVVRCPCCKSFINGLKKKSENLGIPRIRQPTLLQRNCYPLGKDFSRFDVSFIFLLCCRILVLKDIFLFKLGLNSDSK